MYLLDTNHLSALLLDEPAIVARLAIVGQSRISTAVVVAGELSFMAQKSDRPRANQERVNRLLEVLTVLSLTLTIANIYGQIKAEILDRFGPKDRARRRQFEMRHLGFTEPDLWIAASAREHGLTLVSADRDFARIAEATGIVTESWFSDHGP